MWTSRGTIYEGLLERNAGEVKSGAGAILHPPPTDRRHHRGDGPRPHPDRARPGGRHRRLLLSAYEHMKTKEGARDRTVARHCARRSYSGNDIVAEVVRLCAMNLYSARHRRGSLAGDPEGRLCWIAGRSANDMILTNPPFGKRQSFRIVPRGRGHQQRAAGLCARRLHRHHGQQAAQLPPAHHVRVLKVGGLRGGGDA